MIIDQRLNCKIISLLKQHPQGGERFFNALDLMIRSDQDILLSFYRFLEDDGFLYEILSDNSREVGLIVSGNFGRAFLNRFLKSPLVELFDDIICVNGGIRTGQIPELYKTKELLLAQDYIFIDDSFYSGTTRDRINQQLMNLNPDKKIIQTYVIYDGSRPKDDKIASMFKYYDISN